MFPYNPAVNDTSGQIQAEYNLKGNEAIVNGISNAGSAIAGGMAAKAQQGQMDRKTLDMNLGKMDQYQAAGLMDAETYAKFTAMPVSKMSGALAGFDATVVNPYIQAQGYQNQMKARQMYGQTQPSASTGSPLSF
jgi:hypothetical protein